MARTRASGCDPARPQPRPSRYAIGARPIPGKPWQIGRGCAAHDSSDRLPRVGQTRTPGDTGKRGVPTGARALESGPSNPSGRAVSESPRRETDARKGGDNRPPTPLPRAYALWGVGGQSSGTTYMVDRCAATAVRSGSCTTNFRKFQVFTRLRMQMTERGFAADTRPSLMPCFPERSKTKRVILQPHQRRALGIGR